jgi:hypothetical protein
MPHVTVWDASTDRPMYQLGGKSFVFFRSARPDATDPETGEHYDDVIRMWVASEDDKQALDRDAGSAWFSTLPSTAIRRYWTERAGSASSAAKRSLG